MESADRCMEEGSDAWLSEVGAGQAHNHLSIRSPPFYGFMHVCQVLAHVMASFAKHGVHLAAPRGQRHNPEGRYVILDDHRLTKVVLRHY